VHWSPNQLRHTAADLADQRAGIETAQELLGHRTARTTETYLARKGRRAAEYQRKFG
jgi:integrase